MRVPPDGDKAARLLERNRSQRAGREPDADLAAPARIIAPPDHFELCGHAHPFEQWQEDVGEVVDRWRLPHIRAARDRDRNAAAARDHGRKQRLQDQDDAACRAHVKAVLAPG